MRLRHAQSEVGAAHKSLRSTQEALNVASREAASLQVRPAYGAGAGESEGRGTGWGLGCPFFVRSLSFVCVFFARQARLWRLGQGEGRCAVVGVGVCRLA